MLHSMKTWPADKIVRRRIDSLAPYAKNARVHSAAQIAQIAKSISEYGFTAPVLTDENGQIIAGHGRVEAARSLGLDEVPTMTAENWSEVQRRAYGILDNKIALNASWDEAILGAEFAELEGLGFDLGNLAFEPAEIASIRDTRAVGLTDPEVAPEAPAEPTATTGDLWALGRHRLLCGDATRPEDAQRVLIAKPHLMVTDPPYGVNYDATWRGKAGLNPLGANRTGKVTADDKFDWREAWGLFGGSIIYVWHGGLHSPIVADSLIACGFDLRAQIIWNKTVMAMSRGDYHWKHEPCWYAVRGTGNWTGDRTQTTVWDIASPIHIMGGSKEDRTPHPTQKPVECMKRPIENNSKPGDAIYDPFVGSGTTIIAAEMTARKCCAIEINAAYVDVAIMRWQAFTGLEATLGEQTFSQVSEHRKRKDR